jgi:hypothetical protein
VIDPPVHLSASLQLVVNSIQAQMDELIQQKLDVVREIRNLRKRLRLLQEAGQASATSKRSHRGRRGRVSVTSKYHKVHRVSEQLWRACRIALMESSEPTDAKNIYLRIERRRSYVFSCDEDPMRAIARTLNVMVEAGEVSRAKFDSREDCGWTLAKRVPE